MILTSLSKPVTKSTSSVKLHPSLQLTLVLFAFMLTIGLVSGVVGFWLGHQSLKEVTQPAINPFLNDDPESINQRPRQSVSFLPEKEILAKVKTQISSAGKPNVAKPKQTSAKPKDKDKNTKASKADKTAEIVSPQSFPIKIEEKAVQFEVRSATQTEERLLLNVALKNNSSKPIQFIYTFLDIEDDQGTAFVCGSTRAPYRIKTQERQLLWYDSSPRCPARYREVGLLDSDRLS